MQQKCLFFFLIYLALNLSSSRARRAHATEVPFFFSYLFGPEFKFLQGTEGSCNRSAFFFFFFFFLP